MRNNNSFIWQGALGKELGTHSFTQYYSMMMYGCIMQEQIKVQTETQLELQNYI